MLDFFLTNDNNMMDFVVDSDILIYLGRLELEQIKYLNKFSIVESATYPKGRAVLAMDSYCLSLEQVGFILKQAEPKIKKMQKEAAFKSEAIDKFLDIFETVAKNQMALRIEAD